MGIGEEGATARVHAFLTALMPLSYFNIRSLPLLLPKLPVRPFPPLHLLPPQVTNASCTRSRAGLPPPSPLFSCALSLTLALLQLQAVMPRLSRGRPCGERLAVGDGSKKGRYRREGRAGGGGEVGVLRVTGEGEIKRMRMRGRERGGRAKGRESSAIHVCAQACSPHPHVSFLSFLASRLTRGGLCALQQQITLLDLDAFKSILPQVVF